VKPELDQALVRDFPLLFAGPSRARTKAMPKDALRPFGFECGDGWEPVIRRLAEKLEPILRALPPEIREKEGIRCFWAKEKYGGLRFDLCGYPQEPLLRAQVIELIEAAQKESYHTCEACGAPGIPSTRFTSDPHYWVQTLCEEHHRARFEAGTGRKL
jgi:hypothetical protein